MEEPRLSGRADYGRAGKWAAAGGAGVAGRGRPEPRARAGATGSENHSRGRWRPSSRSPLRYALIDRVQEEAVAGAREG